MAQAPRPRRPFAAQRSRGGTPWGVTIEALADPEHIDRCVELVCRHKRRKADAAELLARREAAVYELAEALAAGDWRPGPIRVMRIRQPKPRIVACTPIRDRVVERALCERFAPGVLRRASEMDQACRPGAGTHRARRLLLEAMRRTRWCLHLDLAQYFASIDPARVRRQVTRWSGDEGVLRVVDRLMERGRGLLDIAGHRDFLGIRGSWPPRGRGLAIGSSWSQLLAAHVHLQDLDHYVKRVLRPARALRYVDDLFLFDDSRSLLRAARGGLVERARNELDLLWKDPAASIRSTKGRLRVLGCNLRRAGATPVGERFESLERRLAQHWSEPADKSLRASLRARGGELFAL